MAYIAGIDIGGTNTDAVVVDEKLQIIKFFKTPTTIPLEYGVKKVLQDILDIKDIDSKDIKGINIGTTHALNAILENEGLYRVGVIRIAGHNPMTLHPCFAWPKDIRESVFSGYETIDGGYECDSREITPFNRRQAMKAAQSLIDKKAEGIAVVGVFSSINNRQENVCAEIIKDIAGESFPVTLSHEIGGIGFIERENATILNVALKKPMKQGFCRLQKIKDQMGFDCPLFITQNDGSLFDLFQAIKYPLLTISSGPTNSFIGASKLLKEKEAVVIDVGGTSTDIGVIKNGYPRRSMHNANIGGIALNFRIPDVLTLALGGGSYITTGKNNSSFKIGPKSCGHRLFKESQVFGGKNLTLTDVAAMTGVLDIYNQAKNNFSIGITEAKEILNKVSSSIIKGIDLMRGEKKDLPVISVGGGAGIAFSCSTLTSDHAKVANAYGAALAEVSATIDTVVNLAKREEILDDLKEKAINMAIAKGAKNKETRIVDVQIVPYHYVPGKLARVVVIASGPLIS